jgi:hypothetical protein
MKPWPMVKELSRPWTLLHPCYLALLLFVALALPLPAQNDGVWRLRVRDSVTRGEAERAIQALEDIPGIEMVELPSGAYAVYAGRYASEEDAQRAHDRFLETGVRLGVPIFIPSATPTPGATTPTPSATASAPPTPVAGPQPAGQTPDTSMGQSSPTPASGSSGGSKLPLQLILAIAAGVIVVGAGVYFFMRKKAEPPPPPAPVKPMAPLPVAKPRPKPAASPAVSRPEPKVEPAPVAAKAEPEPPAKPAAIEFARAMPDTAPEPPPPARQPIAMPEVPVIDPTPSIILNDIFEDEPETPASATPLAEEGPRLDFLMDEEPKSASASGNGSSATGDEGLGIPFNLGGATATPMPESAPQRNVPTGFGAGSIIFEQDLSDATPDYPPPGWTGSYDYARLKVVKDPESGDGPHMRFEKETGIGSAYYSCQFPEAHGRLAVDFEIRCDDKNKYLLGFYIEKDQDFRQSIHALIHRTNAKANPVLRLQNESVPYEFGTWRRVRYEIDLVRHIIDGFVDDEPVIVGQRLTSCPDGLNTLSIRDNLATTGVLLLRNLRITALD